MSTVVGVALVRRGRVLAARRSRGDDAGGWEFPGGKVEPGESDDAAAVREVAEELGCTVETIGWLEPVVEIRAGLVLRVALAEIVAGEPVPRDGDHDAILWARGDGLASIAWLPADLPFVAELTANGVLAAD